jgi:hypothetical protein
VLRRTITSAAFREVRSRPTRRRTSCIGPKEPLCDSFALARLSYCSNTESRGISASGCRRRKYLVRPSRSNRIERGAQGRRARKEAGTRGRRLRSDASVPMNAVEAPRSDLRLRFDTRTNAVNYANEYLMDFTRGAVLQLCDCSESDGAVVVGADSRPIGQSRRASCSPSATISDRRGGVVRELTAPPSSSGGSDGTRMTAPGLRAAREGLSNNATQTRPRFCQRPTSSPRMTPTVGIETIAYRRCSCAGWKVDQLDAALRGRRRQWTRMATNCVCARSTPSPRRARSSCPTQWSLGLNGR